MKYKHHLSVILFLCMLLCLNSYPVIAEEYDHCLTDVQGDWKIDYPTGGSDTKNYAMTPAESEAFWASMHQIVGTFQKAKLLNPPMGIMMRGDAQALKPDSFYSQYNPPYKNQRVQGDIWLKFIELRRGNDGKLMEYTGGDESHPQMNIQTNRPSAISVYSGFGYERIYDNQGREIFYQPVETGRLSGYPVYDNNVLVIHDKSKPLFVPVTREQYLNAYIYWTEYQEKQTNTEGQNSFLTDALKKELQEMTAEEKKLPAYINMGRQSEGLFRMSWLVDPETEEDRPLVMFNPQYFDNSRPRTDVQLITLEFLRDYPLSLEEPLTMEVIDEGYDLRQHIDSVRFSQLMYSMDYTSLAKLLAKSAASSQTDSSTGTINDSPGTPSGKTYSGASGWAVPELDKAAGYGLITDRIKNNMSAKVTREEFAEIAVKLYEKYTGKTAAEGNVSFTDTSNPEILKAANLGLVAGVGNSRYDPGAPITREQMAAILLRTFKVINPAADFSTKGAPEFADDNKVESWARDGVYYCSKAKIVSGVGSNRFDPDGSATREMAVIVCTRAYELYKSGSMTDSSEDISDDQSGNATKSPEIYTNKNGFLGEGDNDFKTGEYLEKPKWIPSWFPIDKNANITSYFKKSDEYTIMIYFTVDKELTKILKEYQNTFKNEAGYKSTSTEAGSNINFKTAKDKEEWNINFYSKGDQKTDIVVSGVGCPE